MQLLSVSIMVIFLGVIQFAQQMFDFCWNKKSPKKYFDVIL